MIKNQEKEYTQMSKENTKKVVELNEVDNDEQNFSIPRLAGRMSY